MKHYVVRLNVTSHGATADAIMDDISEKLDDLSVNALVEVITMTEVSGE